jgi:hypothetical protein
LFEESDNSRRRSSNGKFFVTFELLPALQNQASDIKVEVAISASDSILSESVQTEITKSSLKINLPRPWDRDPMSESCMRVNVSMFVRPKLVMENLLLDLDESRMHIPSPVDLIITNATRILLSKGGLDATPFFTSRETRIEVGAGSVTGEYPLFDLLQIQTHAGSVTINIIPQEVDKTNPLPAVLSIKSSLGSIHTAFPPPGTSIIPTRDYHTTVHSHRGSITGTYIHGSQTLLSSTAGSITTDILPYTASAYNSTLHTFTTAGSQNINLLSPYISPGRVLSSLTSKHITHAASLDIAYPSEWEGHIEGSTAVGALTLRGEVRIIKEGGLGPVGRYVVAEKGDGRSEMEFRTGAGSAFVEMG